jgi:hypothetical protein
MADGYWRIKTNQEINDILKGQNIIGFIKKQRLNWLRHVERMTESNIVQKIKDGNPCPNAQSGGPKHAGKMTFGRHKEFECKQLEKKLHRIEIDGRR